jgi:hypothetical protein
MRSRPLANWFAPALAAAAATYFLAAPPYSSSTSGAAVTAGGAATSWEAAGRAGIVAVNGADVLLPLLMPVLLAALPLLARSAGWRRGLSAAAALILGAFALLGAASVGLFYAPAAVALGLAAARRGEHATNHLTSG